MRDSTHEVEIKLRFDSPEAAMRLIQRTGATLVQPRMFEDNQVFDRNAEPLKPRGKLLRLRRLGDRAWLTLKIKVAGPQRYKVAEEHETPVGNPDAVERLLKGLGFRGVWRYQKYRTLFRLDDLDLCLDETPLGCFVELEGAPNEIDRVAEQWGFAPDNYIRESYRALHEREAGDEPCDLLLEPEAGPES